MAFYNIDGNGWEKTATVEGNGVHIQSIKAAAETVTDVTPLTSLLTQAPFLPLPPSLFGFLLFTTGEEEHSSLPPAFWWDVNSQISPLLLSRSWLAEAKSRKHSRRLSVVLKTLPRTSLCLTFSLPPSVVLWLPERDLSAHNLSSSSSGFFSSSPFRILAPSFRTNRVVRLFVYVCQEWKESFSLHRRSLGSDGSWSNCRSCLPSFGADRYRLLLF